LFAGKTSIIKALTGEQKLEPKNSLFATLDVTMHEGYLPSRLKVVYVDTVGFMSNLPDTLLDCFVATLEHVAYAVRQYFSLQNIIILNFNKKFECQTMIFD
jgi:50S ribosomal subunit-associated GTPase HflX